MNEKETCSGDFFCNVEVMYRIQKNQKNLKSYTYMFGLDSRDSDKTTACEIECQLLSRSDPRHQSLCMGLEDVSCPIIGITRRKNVPDVGVAESSKLDKFLPSRVISWIRELRGGGNSVNSSGVVRGEKIVRREISQVATNLSWCPNAEVVACAFVDDSVRLFDLRKRIWKRPRLEHVFQKDIREMAWRPMVPNTLAVACLRGVCVWTLTGRSAWMRFLKDPDGGPVLSLCWSPDGKWLASCSARGNVVRLWEPELSSASPESGVSDSLYFVQSLLSDPVRVTMLSWSPSGHYLVASTSSGSVIIWETWTWTSETWDLAENFVCRSMTWNGEGDVMLLAAEFVGNTDTGYRRKKEESLKPIYMLRFYQTPPQISASLDILSLNVVDTHGPSLDSQRFALNQLVEYKLKDNDHWRRAKVKGVNGTQCDLESVCRHGENISKIAASSCRVPVSNIAEIALDPTAERLAVSFTGSQRSRISLFSTQIGDGGDRSNFSRMRDDIVGPFGDDVYPVSIQFRPKMARVHLRPRLDRGALLSVLWSNGCITFYPMSFAPALKES
jgi:hypothetical protein